MTGSVYLFKSVDTVDFSAQSRVDRNNGERFSISESCRSWLGIVAPVEGEDDGGIVSILGYYFLIVIAVPGADISLG